MHNAITIILQKLEKGKSRVGKNPLELQSFLGLFHKFVLAMGASDRNSTFSARNAEGFLAGRALVVAVRFVGHLHFFACSLALQRCEPGKEFLVFGRAAVGVVREHPEIGNDDQHQNDE